jgi:hypothetical protein
VADILVAKVEQDPNGRLLFSVRVQSNEGRMEFPIAVQDEGTAARNEIAALRLYCGPVLRQPVALIQAAKGSSAMFALATESCSALT